MANIAFALERLRRRQRVRYWALALPLLVLAIALPLLRPLRHPDPRTISDDEWVRLESIRALATTGSFSLEADRVEGRVTLLRTPPRPAPAASGGAPATGGPAPADPGAPATTAPSPPVPSPSAPGAAPRSGDPPGATDKGATEEAVIRSGVIEAVLPPARVLPAQEPMLAVFGAGLYLLLGLFGVSAATESVVGPYVFTLVLSTLPVAVTATLLYRCARILELSRPRRVVLGFACVGCTGLLPYATVLGPYPMAAMFATGALACVAQVVTVRPMPSGTGWMLLAGLLAGLGAAVHPSVAAFGAALGLSVLFMRWRRRRHRLAGLLLFALGALPPLAAHRAMLVPFVPDGADAPWYRGWTVPVPDVEPARVPDADVEPGPHSRAAGSAPATRATLSSAPIEDEEAPPDDTFGAATLRFADRVAAVFVGRFGVFTHVPLLLVGAAGVCVMLFRHWPRATRALAAASLVGVLVPLVLWTLGPPRGGERMFGPLPVLAPAPLLLFWAGVFLRNSWVGSRVPQLAIGGWLLAVLSLAIGVIGSLHPYPRGGFSTYPPAQILREQLLDPRRPASPAPPTPRPATRAVPEP